MPVRRGRGGEHPVDPARAGGYGINYFAERWKLRAATVELQGLRSDRDSAAAAVKMDLMGPARLV